MRLLHTSTHRIRVFYGDNIPPYAILSHTWHPDNDQEILFHDIQQDLEERFLKAAYSKFIGSCRIAAENGYEWIWNDTCCIDKSSSAELTEAINSMYQYYAQADVCYAYLADVDWESDDREEAFCSSRWFTRGWTLQELLAPKAVEFYDKEWREFGTKKSLRALISSITGIREEAVQSYTSSVSPSSSWTYYTIAERMSWAAGRNTTRKEDMAYCLLGIFGVNMPTLYGEGDRAFQRLQEEILKVTEDCSLFAWEDERKENSGFLGVLARLPSSFQVPLGNSSRLNYTRLTRIDPRELAMGIANVRYLQRRPQEPTYDVPPVVTARGLYLTLPVVVNKDPQRLLAFLYCIQQPQGHLVCLPLKASGWDDSGKYWSRDGSRLSLLPAESTPLESRTIYISIHPWFDEAVGFSLTPKRTIPSKRRLESRYRSFLLYTDSPNVPVSQYQYALEESEKNHAFHLTLVHGSVRFHALFGIRDGSPWCHVTAEEELSNLKGPRKLSLLRDYVRRVLARGETDRSQLSLDDQTDVGCSIKERPTQWLQRQKPTMRPAYYERSAQALNVYTVYLSVSSEHKENIEIAGKESFHID